MAREHGADVLSFGQNRGLRAAIAAGYGAAAEMELRLDRPFGDATSGMYAANAQAAELLAGPYVSDAPEVEGLIRLAEAGLRVEEVLVDMRERRGGESKLVGKKALKVVLTVGATILVGRRVLRALRR